MPIWALRQGYRMSEKGLWHPSVLDNTCRGMVISTSWVYGIHIDSARMNDALKKLIMMYPLLGGRLENGLVCYPSGEILFEYSKRNGRVSDVSALMSLPRKYEASFCLKKMLKGKFPLISVRLTDLDDGCIFSMKASHLVMDGRCFYRLANTLMELYGGKNPTPCISFGCDLSGIRIPDAFDASLFYPLPESALFLVLWKKMHKGRKGRILVSSDRIRSIKDSTGASRTAILSAVVYGMLGHKAVSFVQTADHRGHIRAIARDYGGNAASTLPPVMLSSGLSIEEAAIAIDNGIRSCLENDERYFPQYLLLLKEKLPFLPFPLEMAWKSHPECIICNSFISFGIYDGMEADGIPPLYAFPPDLPDPVRFFPAPAQEDGIYILLNF